MESRAPPRPDALVLVEQELWPGMLLEARAARVPVDAVNDTSSNRLARAHSALLDDVPLLLAADTGFGFSRAVECLEKDDKDDPGEEQDEGEYGRRRDLLLVSRHI